MANVLHSTLTGADLHESKGAATASSGQVAIATGAGSAVFGTLDYTQLSGTPTLGSLASLSLVPISLGGTGQTTASAALAALGGKANAGITDGSLAGSGIVGQVLEATGSAMALTTGVQLDVLTLTLTPGDWDLSAAIRIAPTSATITQVVSGLATTALTATSFPNRLIFGFNSTASIEMPLPTKVYNITTSTTIYLSISAAFSSGTATGQGYLRARRIR